MYRALVILPLLFVWACALASPNAPLPTSCEEASEQTEACISSANSQEQLVGECGAAMDQVRASCSLEKADAWGAALCRAGLLHYCSTPACEIPSLTQSDECRAYLDEEGCASCDYYLCKEAADGASACGGDGYYLGYGYKYCERITLVTRPRLSPAGQAWIDEARRCLMEEIEAQVDDEHSCSRTLEIAFDSHPGCYAETGFCSLPWSDIWKVFTTVDPSDAEFQQVLGTGLSCFDSLFD